MEGSCLTHDQIRYIFETNTIGVENEVLNVDDVIEIANYFCCIDMIIDNAKAALTEKLIKELHLILKYNIVPFIIEDNQKTFYYRGLKEWNDEKGSLTDMCLRVQEKYKGYLDYFRIGY